jgi:hypothetical protein
MQGGILLLKSPLRLPDQLLVIHLASFGAQTTMNVLRKLYFKKK